MVITWAHQRSHDHFSVSENSKLFSNQVKLFCDIKENNDISQGKKILFEAGLMK